MRLIKAAVKRFHDYCHKQRLELAPPQLHHRVRHRHPAARGPLRQQRHRHRHVPGADAVPRRRRSPSLPAHADRSRSRRTNWASAPACRTASSRCTKASSTWTSTSRSSRPAATATTKPLKPARSAAAVRGVRPAAGGGERRAAPQPAGAVQPAATRRWWRRCRSTAMLTDRGRAALLAGDWDELGQGDERELRPPPDDHEHRPGEPADGGGRRGRSGPAPSSPAAAGRLSACTTAAGSTRNWWTPWPRSGARCCGR